MKRSTARMKTAATSSRVYWSAVERAMQTPVTLWHPPAMAR